MQAAAQKQTVSRQQPVRILVVDDAPQMVRTVCRFLETLESLPVIGTAKNGLEALEQARAHHPDLVLMDLEMPEMNGMAATELLLREFPRIVVIIVSVNDSQEIRRACRQPGPTGLFPRTAFTKTCRPRSSVCWRGGKGKAHGTIRSRIPCCGK